MSKLRILYRVLKKLIYKNMNSATINSVVDSVLSFGTKCWVAVDVNLRNLYFVPFYYTTAGLVLKIIPFIDLALILFYSIGTYDGTFTYEDMCGVNTNTLQTSSGSSLASASSAPLTPNNIPGAFSVSASVGDPESCLNTPPKVIGSNELKTAEEGSCLNKNNKTTPILEVDKNYNYVDIALLTVSIISHIIFIVVYGIGGNDN